MRLINLSEEKFREFYETYNDLSFMQTVEIGHLKEHYKNKVYYVGMVYNDKVLAATLLLETTTIFGKKSFYAPRGLLIDYDNSELINKFTNELKRFIKSKNGFRLIIDPNIIYRVRNNDGSIASEDKPYDKAIRNLTNAGFKHFGFNNFLETIQVRYGCTLLLDEEYQTTYQKFSKSTKKNIESAHDKGLKVRLGTNDDLEIMEELFQDTAKRKDFQVNDLEYYKNMYMYAKDLMNIYFAYLDPHDYYTNTKNKLESLLKEQEIINNKIKTEKSGKKLLNELEINKKRVIKEQEELAKAETFKKEYPNGKDIACLLSIKSGNEYLTLSSGSLEEYHRFTPKYLMYEQHIKDAYKLGFKKCNFYGISGNFSKDNNPLYGVFEFKRGFNTNVIEYIGQFTLPVTKFNTFYNLLIKIKQLIKK